MRSALPAATQRALRPLCASVPTQRTKSAHSAGMDSSARVAQQDRGRTYGDGHITECSGYVRVDFGSCSCGELSEVYWAFAALCVEKHANRALLKAGDDAPEGHYALHDALHAMARHAVIPLDFKLALVPSTRPVETVYREAQQHLRAAGFNAWVFRSENEALEWLEGRATGGETAS